MMDLSYRHAMNKQSHCGLDPQSAFHEVSVQARNGAFDFLTKLKHPFVSLERLYYSYCNNHYGSERLNALLEVGYTAAVVILLLLMLFYLASSGVSIYGFAKQSAECACRRQCRFKHMRQIAARIRLTG